MPEITVLMPVYNAEKFLAVAIDSILQQSFSDLELLIIDDGSTDNSVAIVQSYTDNRIRLVRNERNLGITATLNKGITLATTDLIARMDADDISLPERLRKQYEFMQAYPECCLVGSRTATISEEGSIRWEDKPESDYTYYNLTFFCAIYHPSVMYRKSIIEAAGMYKLPYAEDYELWCRLARQHKLHVLPDILLHYRLNSNSTSTNLKQQEYSQAELNQILANLKYFTGQSYRIPHSFVECFRYNYKPLLAEKSVSSIVACLKELDKITYAILAKENVNRDIVKIKEAATLKKQHISHYFTHKLPVHKALLLKFRLQFSL
ncbi:glycosyltransferase family 2 protein [Pontibacter fetidus]|uniref:Glycosyltransferase n=1 Tax=Pontibacter fetidus TaxID=2700082 RepID=A0A6B2GUN8_9BACT|nr:glycosyltransferase [Pontibacter fetidus]NDK54535.1 glycosyltransferase [Pontibacter fetidus]